MPGLADELEHGRPALGERVERGSDHAELVDAPNQMLAT